MITKKTETEPLAEFCKICQRVAWGDVVRLGFQKWRHSDCAVGSEAYAAYYAQLPKAEQSKVQEFFEFTNNQGG